VLDCPEPSQGPGSAYASPRIDHRAGPADKGRPRSTTQARWRYELTDPLLSDTPISLSLSLFLVEV